MERQTFSRPVSLFCAAAPADTSFLAQWERHLAMYKLAGHLTFWSERHLHAGANRMEQLLFHLERAECIVLLLSIDFFDNDECRVILTQALQHQLDGTACVIPLLLRPVDWKETELSAFSCLPANGIAITTWEDPEAGWLNAVQGLKRMLGRAVFSSTSLHPAEKRAHTDRERLLRLLRRTYQASLDSSLQGIAWVELGLAEHPDAVRNATHLLQHLPDRTERALPAGTSILSAYDQAEEELLILGAPGAGKSTLLLDLAQHLIARAEADETHPLPVIVPLSSWAITRPALANWLVEQMERIYDLPQMLGRQWIQQGQILPLLDGLDEMDEVARPLCIAAINSYRAARLTPLVVCSRQAEYYVASTHQRLALQNAIMVQPLTQEQVEHVVRQGSESLVALRKALTTNHTLHVLATTPLMLSVLILAYKGTTISNLPQQEISLERRIWTDYVARMVRQKGADRRSRQDKPIKRYTLEQTYRWLGWLAQQMREHNQTSFYGEYLLEDWLPAAQQQTIWWLVICLPTVLLGVFTSMLLSFFFSAFFSGVGDPAQLLRTGLVGGFIGWCCSRNQGRKALAVADISQRTSWEHTRKVQLLRLLGAVLFGLLFATSFGLDLSPSYTAGKWLSDGISFGSSMAISAWFLQFLFAATTRSPVRSLSRWSRLFAWVQVTPGHQALWIGTIFGIGLTLSGGLGDEPRSMLSSMLHYGLYYGGTAYLVSRILDTQAGTVLLVERVSWTWRDLLRWRHLKTSLVVAFVCLVTFGLQFGLGSSISSPMILGWYFGLDFGLGYGLSIGLSYWLLLGIYMGMTQKHLKDQDRHRFNQGLHRSLRNGFLLSLLGAGIITGIGILNTVLGFSLSFHLNGLLLFGWEGWIYIVPGTNVVWPFVVCSWPVVWAAAGGLTILRHYILRSLLARNRAFPWRVQRFLDDATARALLRRVGGGYEFVHRRLLDYFVDQDTPSKGNSVTHKR